MFGGRWYARGFLRHGAEVVECDLRFSVGGGVEVISWGGDGEEERDERGVFGVGDVGVACEGGDVGGVGGRVDDAGWAVPLVGFVGVLDEAVGTADGTEVSLGSVSCGEYGDRGCVLGRETLEWTFCWPFSKSWYEMWLYTLCRTQ